MTSKTQPSIPPLLVLLQFIEHSKKHHYRIVDYFEFLWPIDMSDFMLCRGDSINVSTLASQGENYWCLDSDAWDYFRNFLNGRNNTGEQCSFQTWKKEVRWRFAAPSDKWLRLKARRQSYKEKKKTQDQLN